MDGTSKASFTLVAGLSSSGKSTWLERHASGPTIIPFEFGDDLSKLPEGALVHYNTLRYADNDVLNIGRPFEADPFLREVLRRSGDFDVVYICASPADLLRRIETRRTVERGEGVYPGRRIARAMAAIDHRAFHAAWIDLFARHARELRLILSDAEGFREVGRDELLDLMGVPKAGLIARLMGFVGRLRPRAR